MGSSRTDTSRKRDSGRSPRRLRDWLRLAVPFVVLAGLAAAWKFTPLGKELGSNLQDWVGALRDMPGAPLVVIGVFVAAGMLMVPVTVLILGTVVGFGAWPGGLYAMLGALASAMAGFLLGRVLGRSAVERLLGGRMEKVAHWFTRRGVVTVAVVRNMPVAPYSMVNLAAGATELRAMDFLAGTVIGLAPGIVAFSVFGETIVHFAENPTWKSLAVVVGVVVVMVAVSAGVGKLLLRVRGDDG